MSSYGLALIFDQFREIQVASTMASYRPDYFAKSVMDWSDAVEWNSCHVQSEQIIGRASHE